MTWEKFLFRLNIPLKLACLHLAMHLNNDNFASLSTKVYIYAFSRRFYPKRLTLHSSYSFTFYQLLLSLGMEPMVLALLAPCSTIWTTGKLI